MKKYLLTITVFICTNTQAQKQTPPKTTAPPVKLLSTADSTQYALGAYVGLWITTNGFSITNNTLFQKGLDDVLKNRPKPLSDSSIGPRITAYQLLMQQSKAVQQEKDLFASLITVPGIGMFPNGVRYLVHTTGNGSRPGAKDSILVNLIAKLPDGTVVEDTYRSKKPFAATASSFFPGLNDALQMMTAGSRWQLYVPALLAYADKGTTLIPPHSALILEVELLSVKPPKN